MREVGGGVGGVVGPKGREERRGGFGGALWRKGPRERRRRWQRGVEDGSELSDMGTSGCPSCV